MTIKSPVLVLNASYEPIAICQARRALTLLVIKGAAAVEESHDVLVWRNMRMPSVIRLSRYRKVPLKRHVVTRRNIFSRDQNACQYCGVVFSTGKLTLDHVLPRSRGGRDTWENLVACCDSCNHRKADRTPEEAGMALIRMPRAVNVHSARSLMRTRGEDFPLWRKYLYF
jgi:5-methylcytosine-specific restriction endonuclease McrA